jgi:glycerol-3-phosphate dehydrogenase (NAD(P)+)
MSDSVAILGAGAWGTALAVHLARSSASASTVGLWARDASQAAAIDAARENARYLPGVQLPPAISVLGDLELALQGASLLVVATPIGELIPLVRALHTHADIPLMWVGKGFVASADAGGVALAHQRVVPLWRASVGVISGPSFAEEVARGLPTAVSIAATDRMLAERVATLLRGDTFRAYVSDDLVGVEVGGAVKNVLAIAAGLSDGLGFGNNARAALVTRGLAETGRLSIALGGRRETLMGLAGLGDLVLTCTGDLSRNRRVGLALAAGRSLDAITAGLGHVAEGIAAARAAHTLAESLEVETPICSAVYRVLHENLSPRRAVEALLSREPGPEFH